MYYSVLNLFIKVWSEVGHSHYDYVYDASVAPAVGPRVTTSSTDFSFQILLFWNLFAFSAAEIT